MLQSFRLQRLMAQSVPPPADPAVVKPDIIVVLRESNANIYQLWEEEEANHKVLQSSTRTDWRGEMLAHSFGGGTWLAEFAFLTGFRAFDFGPAGSYAPYTLAPRMREALPVQLHRLGYRTMVIYPVHGTFLNAREAYRNYGFDDFYSSDELNLTEKWIDLPDRAMYAAALEHMHKPGDGRPVFAFVLTIRNHGPHNRAVAEGSRFFPSDWPQAARAAVTDYLDRQDDTERDYAWLSQQWLAAGPPRVLLSFGDHWPSLEGGILEIASRSRASGVQSKLFHTPLRMEANFVLPCPLKLKSYDIAFLGATLLESVGLDRGRLFSGNLWMRDHLNGSYTAAEGQGPTLVTGSLTWAHETLGAWQ